MATLTGTILADFTTSLASAMAIGAVTATLQSATDDDGVALPTGTYYFTLDGSNSSKEHIRCTLTGTALTNIYSISRQGVATSGCVRAHRLGATVSLTDFAHILVINDLIRGATDLDASNPLKYDANPALTLDEELATKKYVDDVAIAGAPDATTAVKGITKMSVPPVSAVSPIAVGDNDPRVPTQDENDALAGTSGAPSTSNKYVTDADTATAATANKIARRLAGGNITVGTESQGDNSTKAASTAYVDTGLVAFNDRTPFIQTLTIPHISGSGTASNGSTATTGFSTTEPLFVVAGGSTGSRLTRYVKLADGSMFATHIVSSGLFNVSQITNVCVVGNYVYLIGGSTTSIQRFDKADLTNATTMTTSGTNFTANTPIFSDGTFIYNVYTAGSAKKYTISGTTVTSGADTAFTSMSATNATWCDGTSVYQMNVSGATYKWALAGGARTTGTTFVPDQFSVQNLGLETDGGFIVKQNGNTNSLFIGIMNTSSNGWKAGKIIPIATF